MPVLLFSAEEVDDPALLLDPDCLVLLLSAGVMDEPALLLGADCLVVLLLCADSLLILLCSMLFGTKESILLLAVYSLRRSTGLFSSSITNVFGTQALLQ